MVRESHLCVFCFQNSGCFPFKSECFYVSSKVLVDIRVPERGHDALRRVFLTEDPV